MGAAAVKSVSNGPSPNMAGGEIPRPLSYWDIVLASRRSDYAEFRRLWEEAGKRNESRRAYTEDHGPGWWITQAESDAIAARLRAFRIQEAARAAFVRYYAAHFEVWAVGGDGVPRLRSVPKPPRWLVPSAPKAQAEREGRAE